MSKEGIIEYVCHGGFGGEATVCLELRTKFEGIGGTVVTEEGIASALRAENNPAEKSGHKMFLRHAIIKKVEDYFHRKGRYVYSHVSRPLGSISQDGKEPYEAYVYEWAFGMEGFSWVHLDGSLNKQLIHLHDWDRFVANFLTAGIDMMADISDAEDADRSKNIIHQYPIPLNTEGEMNLLWKRIDFGYQSVKIDFAKLEEFLSDNQEDLVAILRFWRYEMLILATQYLQDSKNMRERDIGRLEMLVADYRRSTLHHLVSKSASPSLSTIAYVQGIDEQIESLS